MRRALVLLAVTVSAKESGGIAWTKADGGRRVVQAAVRKWFGKRHVHINATGAHVVEFSSDISSWLCAHGESRLPPQVAGALVVLHDLGSCRCVRENIYLAFRGAGARAVLAGVRSPVGSLYYAHANIYIARRAAMPWLDVDSTELFTVADAISAGDNVIIESTTPNAYHDMFRSAGWVLFFQVLLPAAAATVVFFAARNMRAMGGRKELLRSLTDVESPSLLPFLVLLVESICMISVAIVASVFGLYWSGDIGGRWAADMHVSMLAGGGFFTSVLMAVHLSKMRKLEHLRKADAYAVQNAVDDDAVDVVHSDRKLCAMRCCDIGVLFLFTVVLDFIIMLLWGNQMLPFAAVSANDSALATESPILSPRAVEFNRSSAWATCTRRFTAL